MFLDSHLIFASLWIINCEPSTPFFSLSNPPDSYTLNCSLLHIKFFALFSNDWFLHAFQVSVWIAHSQRRFPLLLNIKKVQSCYVTLLIISMALITTSLLYIFTARRLILWDRGFDLFWLPCVLCVENRTEAHDSIQ